MAYQTILNPAIRIINLKSTMKKLITLLLLTAPLVLQAQLNEFSLEAAIEYGLEKHASTKNALIDEEIAEKKITQLKQSGTPQISFSGEINDFIDVPTSFVPGDFFGAGPGKYIPVQFGQQYSASGGFNFSQLLFDGSYIIGLQAASTYRELSVKQTKQSRTDVAINITKAYFGALVSDANLEIVEANIQRVEKLTNETKALYKAGFVEKVDVDRLELTYNNLLVEKEKAKSFKTLSHLLLKFHMNYPSNEGITLTDKLEDIARKKTEVPDEVNLNNRPEFEILTTNRKLQELDVKLSHAKYLPSLVAFGTFSYNNAMTSFDFFNTGRRWYPTTLIGAKLSFPIWGGLQRSTEVSQSRLELKKIDNALDLMKNSFQIELESAKRTYQNSLMSLEIVKKNRELAKEIARISKVKYDNGLGSSLELNDAESTLRESDANYFRTLYETLVARTEVERISGTIQY